MGSALGRVGGAVMMTNVVLSPQRCVPRTRAGGRHEGGGRGDGEKDKGRDEFELRKIARSKRGIKSRYSTYSEMRFLLNSENSRGRSVLLIDAAPYSLPIAAYQSIFYSVKRSLMIFWIAALLITHRTWREQEPRWQHV